ncbi:hypothetical protein MKQ70_28590 [Chitinophaga sedimenti]|uniref:hypothetical protein n=1 Tax=Chitinophaga sedimenti TaxID=2033606 RepID=UPI00200408F5|nr:hypothetical protein [Chitinophaga sedimenti]MCK7558734.1 hypothetical protein [Chitinophaga sedimenti]
MALLLIGALNWMVKHDWVDSRNKAYGMNYRNKNARPEYSVPHLQRFFTAERAAADKAATLQILNTGARNFPPTKNRS